MAQRAALETVNADSHGFTGRGHDSRRRRSVAKAHGQLSAELGREPLASEIAERVELNLSTRKDARRSGELVSVEETAEILRGDRTLALDDLSEAPAADLDVFADLDDRLDAQRFVAELRRTVARQGSHELSVALELLIEEDRLSSRNIAEALGTTEWAGRGLRTAILYLCRHVL